ncbi:MAG TPA: ABC-type transport auxiliary lipoprotein family protein [Syntrophales bacterium]
MSPRATCSLASYRVVVDVFRFESAPGGAVTPDAVWTTRSTKGDRSLTGRTILRESTQDAGYAALVASHSAVLGRLSSDIAAAIRTMEETEK